MSKKTINSLLLIASILLLIAGVILLCVSILGQNETTLYIAWAASCLILANLFNFIRKTDKMEK